MTTKERILFATLTGSLAVASVAGQILLREYDRVKSERIDLSAQIVYLVSVLAEKGVEVEVFNGLAVVTETASSET